MRDKTIFYKFLTDYQAAEGYIRFLRWEKRTDDPIKILNILIEEKRYEWANHFLVTYLKYENYVKYAVYAAEQVIDIYKKQYPNDKRPREAIKAAKRCIKNPSKKNKKAALIAAKEAYASANANDYAAFVAVHPLKAMTEYKAPEAVDAAAFAAFSAAEAAARESILSAAGAARAAAYATGITNTKYEPIQLKILKYGLSLVCPKRS